MKAQGHEESTARALHALTFSAVHLPGTASSASTAPGLWLPVQVEGQGQDLQGGGVGSPASV